MRDIKNNFVIKNLSVSYDKRNIINNLNLSLTSGEFICIIGPNGSGKSTLLKSMAKVLKHKKGTIKFNDKFINKKFKYWFMYNLCHFLKLPINKYSLDNFLIEKVDNFSKKDIKNKYEILKIINIAKNNGFDFHENLITNEDKKTIKKLKKIININNYNEINKKILSIKFSSKLKKLKINLNDELFIKDENNFYISFNERWITNKLKVINFFAKLFKYKNNETIFSFEKPYLTSSEYSRCVSFIPQITNFPTDITVYDFVMMGRYPYQSLISNNKDINEMKVENAIKRVNLLEFKDSYINELSGGQKQRALIALALAQDTETILLDEPTNHLDIKHQLEIISLLHELNHEFHKTIILVIHDINQGIRHSDRIIVMNKGDIVVNGKTEKVLTNQIIKDVFGVECKLSISKKKRKIEYLSS